MDNSPLSAALPSRGTVLGAGLGYPVPCPYRGPTASPKPLAAYAGSMGNATSQPASTAVERSESPLRAKVPAPHGFAPPAFDSGKPGNRGRHIDIVGSVGYITPAFAMLRRATAIDCAGTPGVDAPGSHPFLTFADALQ